MRIFQIMVIMLFVTVGFGQTDKSKILAKTQVQELLNLSSIKHQQFVTNKKKGILEAKRLGIDTSGIIGYENNRIIFSTEEDNVQAAAFSNTDLLHPGGSLGLDLQGTGFTIGQWESGNPLISHEQFKPNQGAISRVSVPDVSFPGSHATHVAGTLIGDGTGIGMNAASAKGMAPNARLRSYDLDDDTAEMALEASSGLLISNHSYGDRAGWHCTTCSRVPEPAIDTFIWYGTTFNQNSISVEHGLYDQKSSDWDNIAWLAPYYTIVKSAGNERNDNPGDYDLKRVKAFFQIGYQLYNPSIHPAGDGIVKNGYDTNRTYGSIKNGLVVANWDGPNNNIVASSSWGPTDDGRMKPDISAHGRRLYSSDVGSATSYDTKTGTSMSTPTVAGSALLLQEHYEDVMGSGNFMTSASLRALIYHTALDIGPAGPDYQTGYGLMQTDQAAMLINQFGSSDPDAAFLIEAEHSENDQYYGIISDCGSSPMATMAYTDPAGIPQDGIDIRTKNLVNDLDMTILGRLSTSRTWNLDYENPSNLFTRGDNDIENSEQVIALPQFNINHILIQNEGSLQNGSQPYSLIVNGHRERCNSVVGLQDGTIGDGNYCSTLDLQSKASIESTREVEFTSNYQIEFRPGFHAKAGSSVKAAILEPCN